MTRHLLIVDAGIEPKVLDGLRGVLERSDRTVQVVYATEAVRLLSLLSAGLFASVGIVFHGPGVPSWLLDRKVVLAVNRCLAQRGFLDLLGCSVRPEDLMLSALHTLYPDHSVCASTDVTGAGRNGNWTLELLVQEGGRVSLDRTRSLAQIYFTSAVYDLDIQLFQFSSSLRFNGVNLSAFAAFSATPPAKMEPEKKSPAQVWMEKIVAQKADWDAYQNLRVQIRLDQDRLGIEGCPRGS